MSEGQSIDDTFKLAKFMLDQATPEQRQEMLSYYRQREQEFEQKMRETGNLDYYNELMQKMKMLEQTNNSNSNEPIPKQSAIPVEKRSCLLI